MKYRYIHYGSSCFCRYKYTPITNDPTNKSKPKGGLWGSPLGEDSRSSWADWWEEHNNKVLRQVWFAFDYKGSAKVLHVTTLEDIVQHHFVCSDAMINFEAMAKVFDVLIVDYSAILQGQNSTFSGWECDTILILNKSVVTADRDD